MFNVTSFDSGADLAKLRRYFRETVREKCPSFQGIHAAEQLKRNKIKLPGPRANVASRAAEGNRRKG